MDLIDDFPRLNQAIARYAPPAGMTDRAKGFLDAAQVAGSPVVRAVNTCEALYAARAQLDDAGRTLCGQLGAFVASHDFHGMADRGLKILRAMRRDLGELKGSGGDPDPLEQWAPGDPQPEPAAAEAPKGGA